MHDEAHIHGQEAVMSQVRLLNVGLIIGYG